MTTPVKYNYEGSARLVIGGMAGWELVIEDRGQEISLLMDIWRTIKDRADVERVDETHTTEYKIPFIQLDIEYDFSQGDTNVNDTTV